MRTRHKAIASVAIVGILALAPAAAFAQQEQAQAATQVTVDLSGLDHGDHQEPLAQTGDEKQLFCKGKPLALSPNEMKMLLFLMRGEGKAFSRDELLNHIWGYNDEVETRVTDETLRRIRSKLSSADSNVLIETVWGYGYRLRSKEGGA